MAVARVDLDLSLQLNFGTREAYRTRDLRESGNVETGALEGSVPVPRD